MIDEIQIRALCRPVKFFHTHVLKLCLYRPRLVDRSIVMLIQERAFNEWLPYSWKHRILFNYILGYSIKIPCHLN